MTHLRILLCMVLLNFAGAVWATGQCGETCSNSSQCTGACKYCDGFFCVSCCDIDPTPYDQDSCEAQFDGCHWNSSQGVCEDIVNAGCNNGIPEAPGMESKGVWLIVAISIIGLVGVLGRRKIQRSKNKS